MKKKYEYIAKTYWNTKGFDLIGTLNDTGVYGYQVVSLIPVMFIDRPDLINKYEVIFMKETSHE